MAKKNGYRIKLYGQLNRKGGALAWLRSYLNCSAMGFDYASDNGEAQTCSAGFGAPEHGTEGTTALVFGHARARITEINGNEAGTGSRAGWGRSQARADGQSAPFRHCLSGVEKQVKKSLLQLRSFAHDRGKFRIEVFSQAHILVGQLVAHQEAELINQLI
jgi:hypothetical protein